MREMRTLHKNFKFKFNKFVKERDTCLHPHLGGAGYTALLPHYLKMAELTNCLGWGALVTVSMLVNVFHGTCRLHVVS